MKLYKLTDKDGRSHGGTQRGENVTHSLDRPRKAIEAIEAAERYLADGTRPANAAANAAYAANALNLVPLAQQAITEEVTA